jgi:hypothetical protein
LLLAFTDDPECDLFPMKILEHITLRRAATDKSLYQNAELQKFGGERYA